MNELKFTGRITAITDREDIQTKSGDVYSKIGFVVEEDAEQYPNTALFELGGKALNTNGGKLSVGAQVSVKFNSRTFSWADKKTGKQKYGCSLSAWSLEVIAPGADAPVVAAPEPAKESDDLPF